MGKRERQRRRDRVRATAPPAAPPTANLAQLRQLVEGQRHLEQAIAASVDQLRAAGIGWPSIAEALGVSRQAARQRALRRGLSLSQGPTVNGPTRK
jgi:hypothetical protein